MCCIKNKRIEVLLLPVLLHFKEEKDFLFHPKMKNGLVQPHYTMKELVKKPTH